MSWDIVLFNSKQTIKSIEELDEDKLEPIDFTGILENSFNEVNEDDNHREIKGKDFSIDFFTDDEMVSNKMLSLYGENGLFELIELAKQHGWQIFDTGLGSMIDLEKPENNGYENHRNYVAHVMKKKE
ncbi:hypothetical protein PBT90_07370 [Algoriphagus halophytocola]|uniref:Uncharacterized protein n=1 Tax=Algoriphagus halophytocola TaxID=2991499 RepID=A0ABY6MHW3_9BACT|nr:MULTISPECIES: hypothetical protein [unclassified Algoriphagus]UZD23208.1 hypothetical protein OM944_01690 [Algoriphagus sp. TR-M5]WBL44501.1 hypothetical protein PBT90_07370 [Algoriphagus sp. TR-M9]